MLYVLGLDADEIVNRKMDQNEVKYPVDKSKGNIKNTTNCEVNDDGHIREYKRRLCR